jgi:hypothetical protein
VRPKRQRASGERPRLSALGLPAGDTAAGALMPSSSLVPVNCCVAKFGVNIILYPWLSNILVMHACRP